MRIRQFLSYLMSNSLRQRSSIEELRRKRIGFDATFWLRSVNELKDPFADIVGGIPPNLFTAIDYQLELFANAEIEVIYVFEGIQIWSHQRFAANIPGSFYQGWESFAEGDRATAESNFAISTSRINTDFVFNVLQYLKMKDCTCLQAPYFAVTQIAYFADNSMIDAVFGPPSLLLFGVPRVITSINWHEGVFHWIDLQQILQGWQLSLNQLIDTCLIAGTEFSYTYPYLKGGEMDSDPGSFTFAAAIKLIKQYPLQSLVDMLEPAELRTSFHERYCIFKLLIQNPIIMQVTEDVASFVHAGHRPSPAVPKEFYRVVGRRLPNALYYLIINGLLSRKLPSVLAIREWVHYSIPTVECLEYQETLAEMQPYRLRSLGLIAMRLPELFQKMEIKFPNFLSMESESLFFTPNTAPGLNWSFTEEDVEKEMSRQKSDKLDFKFVLEWHKNCLENGTSLCPPIPAFPSSASKLHNREDSGGDSSESARLSSSGSSGNLFNGPKSIIALIHLMLLENLAYFEGPAKTTVFGEALTNVPREYQEDALFSLEMMKVALISGEKLEPLTSFPDKVTFVKNENSPNVRDILLLSRVVSLYKMRLQRTVNWTANVDFDLAGFHSNVRVLKKSLRRMSEACLANVLLPDISKIKYLPSNLLCPISPAIPCFALPRNCTGIVMKFFLEYPATIDVSLFSEAEKSYLNIQTGKPEDLENNSKLLEFEVFEGITRKHFPSCIDPVEDLCAAIKFWDMHVELISQLNLKLGEVHDLNLDMRNATQFLKKRIMNVSLNKHACFPKAFLLN